jgi:dTDP-4-dehydrorhamnose reductase
MNSEDWTKNTLNMNSYLRVAPNCRSKMQRQVITYFQKYKPAICINCAAYTAVDKAETEREQSNLANAQAPGILAAACKESQTHFFHISTDYVFDGNSSVPYKESDDTSPANHYGATKLKGEQAAIHNNPRSIIIRTSWVYSEYGNNFVKHDDAIDEGKNEHQCSERSGGIPYLCG